MFFLRSPSEINVDKNENEVADKNVLRHWFYFYSASNQVCGLFQEAIMVMKIDNPASMNSLAESLIDCPRSQSEY